jgi:hypothetical protein
MSGKKVKNFGAQNNIKMLVKSREVKQKASQFMSGGNIIPLYLFD